MNQLNYLSLAKFLPKLFFKKNTLPVYLVFFITHRCNAQCGHCFDWPRRLGISQQDELSLEEIERISSSMGHMLLMSLTGGEPFIRDDLPEIVEIFYQNNKVRYYNIQTTAYFTEKISKQLQKISACCPNAYLKLSVSIDGVEEEHDRIRGVKGLFKNAVNTINEIQRLTAYYPNININAVITQTAYNQNSLIGTYYYLTEKLRLKDVAVSLVRGNVKDPEAKKIDIEVYESLCKEIAKKKLENSTSNYSNPPFNRLIANKDRLSRAIVADIFKNMRFRIPCMAGRIYGILYANGDVEFCEMFDAHLGNVKDFDYDFRRIWLSKKSMDIKESIIRKRCFCTHECALSASLFANPGALLKMLSGIGIQGR